MRLMYAIVVCLALTAPAFAQAPAAIAPDKAPATINRRLERQHRRIQAGTKGDELTKRERARLRARDAAIRAQARVYRRANGGTLTPGERHRLTRELNRTSRRIYRDRHNNREPKP